MGGAEPDVSARSFLRRLETSREGLVLTAVQRREKNERLEPGLRWATPQVSKILALAPRARAWLRRAGAPRETRQDRRKDGPEELSRVSLRRGDRRAPERSRPGKGQTFQRVPNSPGGSSAQPAERSEIGVDLSTSVSHLTKPVQNASRGTRDSTLPKKFGVGRHGRCLEVPWASTELSGTSRKLRAHPNPPFWVPCCSFEGHLGRDSRTLV